MKNPAIITSRSNPKIKWLRSLQKAKFRKQESLFLAEGVRLLEETTHCPIHTLICCVDIVRENERAAALFEKLSTQADDLIYVNENVLQSISPTMVSQGLIAVFPILKNESAAGQKLVLILDGISDPGNMGTMLRTARAANVDQVFMVGNCVDVYSPKVVRSGLGAHFHMAISELSDWSLLDPDVRIVIADAHADMSYREFDWQAKTALIMGSEAHGMQSTVPDERAIQRVTIPMAPGAESLNVAVATGVLLMEAFAVNQSKPK